MDTFRPQDPLFLEPGPAGELLAGRLRLLFTWILLALANFLPLAPAHRGSALSAAAAALLVGVFALALVAHAWNRWLPPLLVVLDVGLAALLLSALRALDLWPAAASASGVELYLLALGLVALRDEPWLLLEAGVACALLLRPWALWPLLVLVATVGLLAALVARGRRLHPLIEHDPLTGLTRRAAFDVRLTLEIARAERYGRRLTAAIVEVAEFKELVDVQGHARGNAVLRAAAGVLSRALRQTDTVARDEGSRFTLLLPETRAAGALARLEALRQALHLAVQGGAGAAAAIQVRMGIAGWPEDGRDAAALIECAEARLVQDQRGAATPVPAPARPRVAD